MKYNIVDKHLIQNNFVMFKVKFRSKRKYFRASRKEFLVNIDFLKALKIFRGLESQIP